MELKMLSCPLCLKPHFDGVDALRTSLISVATSQISCPVCNEHLLGLDKLTIHLFSHITHIVVENGINNDNNLINNDYNSINNSNNVVNNGNNVVNNGNNVVNNGYNMVNNGNNLLNSINNQVNNDNNLVNNINNQINNSNNVVNNSNSLVNNSNSLVNNSNNLVNNSNNLVNNGNNLVNNGKNLLNNVNNLVNNEENNENVKLDLINKEIDNKIYKNNNNSSDRKCIRCDICNFCFGDENILEMHQKLLHQTSIDIVTGTCCYHCHLCSKKFKMKGSLMVHLRVAHYGFGHHSGDGNCANNNNSSLLKQQIKRTVRNNNNNGDHKLTGRMQENKQWECDVCAKMFTTKYFLKKHKRLHTGEMPYYCGQCNKSFTFQQSYHKHMLYHSSEKPHVCNECGRAFKELSTLHNHERIHSGERPFACETCGKCFRQRVSYLVHRRIHTGVMPYKCTVCNKTFRYKVSQRSHKCTYLNSSGNIGKSTNVVTSSNVVTSGDNCTLQFVNNKKSLKRAGEEASGVDSCGSVNTLIFNEKGEIISQNFCLTPSDDPKISNGGRGALKTQELQLENKVMYIDHNQDFLTMVLSPPPSSLTTQVTSTIPLPDVQSLCLNQSRDDSATNVDDNKQTFHTINEESLKQLLYGNDG